jgi:hypothetical protein
LDPIVRTLVERYEKKYGRTVAGLIEHLMEVRPGGFVEDCGVDAYAGKIRTRGRVYDYPVEVITPGVPGACHHVCAYINKIKPSLHIVTGYGYWYRHTWLFNRKKQRIVDIDTRAEVYFGYELSEGEARIFHDYFNREGVFAEE